MYKFIIAIIAAASVAYGATVDVQRVKTQYMTSAETPVLEADELVAVTNGATVTLRYGDGTTAGGRKVGVDPTTIFLPAANVTNLGTAALAMVETGTTWSVTYPPGYSGPSINLVPRLADDSSTPVGIVYRGTAGHLHSMPEDITRDYLGLGTAALSNSAAFIGSASGIGTNTYLYGISRGDDLRLAGVGGIMLRATNSDASSYSAFSAINNTGRSMAQIARGTTASGTLFDYTNADSGQLYWTGTGPFSIGSYGDHPAVMGVNNKAQQVWNDGITTNLGHVVAASNLTVNGAFLTKGTDTARFINDSAIPSVATLFASNSSSQGKAQFEIANDQGRTIFFGVYGSSFVVAGLTNMPVVASAYAPLRIGTDFESATGGNRPVVFAPGGYSEVTAFSISRNGATSLVPFTASGSTNAMTSLSVGNGWAKSNFKDGNANFYNPGKFLTVDSETTDDWGFALRGQNGTLWTNVLYLKANGGTGRISLGSPFPTYYPVIESGGRDALTFDTAARATFASNVTVNGTGTVNGAFSVVGDLSVSGGSIAGVMPCNTNSHLSTPDRYWPERLHLSYRFPNVAGAGVAGGSNSVGSVYPPIYFPAGMYTQIVRMSAWVYYTTNDNWAATSGALTNLSVRFYQGWTGGGNIASFGQMIPLTNGGWTVNQASGAVVSSCPPTNYVGHFSTPYAGWNGGPVCLVAQVLNTSWPATSVTNIGLLIEAELGK